ncbi:b29.3 [miniopterid betaherpesvirus 1]|uniref:B29.3 n=1 Tax=miniopterid betaherpesvirus 1 TaxID=3070189 RepID=I3VQ04_9BETA|nr:b29.3 [miniopterid betaherpesvirus 1]AFK83848.1 b29.3 [miniopterid betaherpesvirus 1]
MAEPTFEDQWKTHVKTLASVKAGNSASIWKLERMVEFCHPFTKDQIERFEAEAEGLSVGCNVFVSRRRRTRERSARAYRWEE